MSNEEIVAQILNGDTGLYGVLGGQVVALVKWKAGRVITALDGCGRLEFDDLVNSGFLALVAAVESYRSDKGAFSTWFMFHLKVAFAEALGHRTVRQKKDPLGNAISLDMDLTDGDDLSLLDTLPDPSAEARIDQVAEDDKRERLHAVLETAIEGLPATQSRILRLRYYDDYTVDQIAYELSVSRDAVQRYEQLAIKNMRHPSVSKVLLQLWRE